MQWILNLAHEASSTHNIDVFVVERPPRGDSEKKFSELNVAANGMLPSLITPLDKVHYIPLPSLNNLSEKSKKNLFTSKGIHLKPWGVKLLRNDIVAGVKSVYKDINLNRSESFQKDGNSGTNSEDRNNEKHDIHPPNRKDNTTRTSPSNQPFGRFDSSRRNESNFHNDHDKGSFNHFVQNQNQNFRGNPGRFNRDERFHTDGNRRFDREQSHHGRNNRDDSFHMDGDRQYDRQQSPNGRQQNNGVGNRNNHGGGQQDRVYDGQQSPNGRQQNNHGGNDRNHHGGGQQEGQMPELVKQYLNTFLRDQSRRY